MFRSRSRPSLIALLLLVATGQALAVSNDQFGAAADLGSAAAATATLDTRLATRQVGEPSHHGDSHTGTTWWKWTAPSDGRWTIAFDESISIFSSYDLAVYTGGGLASLVRVGEESDDPLSVPVTGGTTYWCALAREGVSKLDFAFRPRPANDDFAGRAFLGSAAPLSVTGTTVAGSREPDEPLPGGDSSQGPSSWWEWEPPADGILSLDLTGSSSNGWIVAIYTGTELTALTELAARPSGQTLEIPTYCRVNAGESVFIAAARSTTDVGDDLCLNLAFDKVANNDARADAVDLGSSFPLRFEGNTTAATDDDGGSYLTIWWTWTAPADGIAFLEVDESETSWFGRLAAFRELPDMTLETLRSRWDNEIEFPVLAGETYFLEVTNQSHGGRAATLDLDLQPAPVNDDFADALALSTGETSFDTTSTTVEDAEPGAGLAQSLWWSWSGAADGILSVDMENYTWVRMEVFTGSEAGSLTRVLYGPGSIGTRAGETYHLRISSAISTPKTGVFRSRFRPFDSGNDDFADALDLGDAWSAGGAATLEGATIEAGEPDIGSTTTRSIWWKWTAPADAVFFIDHEALPTFADRKVYTGTTLSNLAAAPLANGAYEASAGEVVYIGFRDTFSGATDLRFNLRAFPALPPNDHFASATDLGGLDEWNEDISFHQATREPGEPLHHGASFPRTLWYRWTPATDRNVRISLAVPFSSQIAVYAGNTLEILVPVASRGESDPVLLFQAEAGESYSIALASQYERRGGWSLKSWAPPPGDRFSFPVDLGSASLSALQGDFSLAAPGPGDPAPGKANQDLSLWFRWVAPADGRLDITNNLFPWGDVRLFEGNSLSSLTEMDALSQFVTAGQEFRLLAQASQVTLDEELRFVASPANDHFTNAIDWGSQSNVTETLMIYAATLEAGEPEIFDPASVAPGSVWWRWTAPFDGAITIRTTYDSFRGNTVALFEGSSLGSLVEVGRVTTSSLRATLKTTVVKGTTYTILAGAGDTRDDATWSIELEAVDTPDNDLWTGALDLGNGRSVLGSGSNVDATPGEFGEITDTVGGGTVWWRWTAPADGSAIAIAKIENEKERVFIFREDGKTLARVPSSYFAGGAGTWAETWTARADQRYFIAVAGRSTGDVGTIQLSVSLADRPGNDLFAERFVLPADPEEVTGTTIGCGMEADEPTHWSGSDSSSAWWSWTAPATGVYRLVRESPLSTTLALYTGANLETLSPVAASNAGELIWSATGGTTYHLAVSDSYGRQTDFSFALEALPSIGNDIANALDLGSARPLTVTGYNLGASAEPGEPEHAGQTATRSVWYRWTAPHSERLSIRDGPGNSSLNLAVYTGTSFADLAEVTSGRGTVAFTSSAGQSYLIAVDDLSDPIRTFTLEFDRLDLPNDDFAHAAVLETLPSEVRGEITHATTEAGEPVSAASPYQTLWWEWTARSPEDLRLSLSGPSGSIYDVFSLPPGAARTFANLDRELVSTGGGSLLRTPAIGTTYFFRVGTTSPGRSGTVRLRFADGFGRPYPGPTGPPNDHFNDRVVLTGELPLQGVVDLGGATIEPGEPLSKWRGDGSAWWSWTAPRDGFYRIIHDTAFSSRTGVFTGAAVNGLSPILSTSRSELFEARAGIAYHIAVHSRELSTIYYDRERRIAGFTLVKGPEPAANDLFADRIDLGSVVDTPVAGTNAGAGAEAGEPGHGGTAAEQSVWWSWTAPESRTYQLNASGALLRAEIYTGEDLASLATVASGTEPLKFNAVAGTAYQFALDRSGPAEFFVNVLEAEPSPPPSGNDAYADAVALTGSFQTLSANAKGSSLEDGEPLHGGDTSQDRSLWWRWTAPADGATSLTISTSGRISVYTGSSLPSLVPLISTTSGVAFFAQAGTSYAIVVSDPASDEFDLTLDQTTPAPPNDQFADATVLTGTDAVVSGTLADSTLEPGEPWHNESPSVLHSSVWYRWTCPAEDLYTLRITDGYPDAIALYTGTGQSDLIPVGYGYRSLTFSAQTGTEYFIAIAESVRGGDFTLELEQVGYPSNDRFADRIAMGSTHGVPMAGTTTNATREPEEPLHQTFSNAGGTVWWSWTAPRDGTAVLEVDQSMILAVYTGTDLGSLEMVGYASGSRLEFPVTTGSLYQLIMGDYNSSTSVGDFEFTIWIDPPSNDDFADRTVLPAALPQQITAINHTATHELGEPGIGGYGGDRSLWWEWTPATTMTVDFTWSSRAGLFTGSVLPALAPVKGTMVGNRILRFTAQAGTTYHLALGNTTPGELSFSLTPARELPPNDFFADAIMLSGESDSSTSHNTGATSEAGEPPDAERSLWWKWTAPRNGLVDISADRNLSMLYFFGAGDSIPELELLPPLRESLYEVVGGTTYHLMVSNNNDHDLTVSIEMTPPGDLFEVPVTIASLDSLRLDVQLQGATWETFEPLHNGSLPEQSIWLSWTAPLSAPVRLRAGNPGDGLRLAVYGGFPITRLSPVAQGEHELVFPAVDGRTYRIAIDTAATGSPPAEFSLLLTVEPEGYGAWRDDFFPDPGDPAASLFANPDGDLHSNLLEYAFGRNPLVNDGGAIPVAIHNDSGFVRLSVRRPTDIPGVRYSFEISSSPAAGWIPTDSLDRHQWQEDHGDGTETFHVLLTDYRHADHPRFFGRLRVDLGSDPFSE